MSYIIEFYEDGLVEGTDEDDFIWVVFGDPTIQGNGGNDKIYGSIACGGDDVISGDILDLTLDFIGDLTSIDYGAGSAVHALIPDFGDDKVFGLSGDDVLYGDARIIDMNVLGVDDSPSMQNNELVVTEVVFDFGDDKLVGGSGNDKVYGDIEAFNLSLISGNNAGANSNASAIVGNDQLGLDGLVLNFGNDSLYGASGHDYLYGDIGTFMHIGRAGSNLEEADPDGVLFGFTFSVNLVGSSSITFGDDVISGGSGNDHIYGDADRLIYDIKAGDDTPNQTIAFSSVNVNSQVRTQYVFGDDELRGNSGHDYLYGDANEMSFTLKAGDNAVSSSVPAILTAVDYTFGADKLKGGSGNDHLYGDVKALTFDLQGGNNASGNLADGEGASADAKIEGATFIFGDDKVSEGGGLFGGSGDDKIYGDIGNLKLDFKGGDNAALGANAGAQIIAFLSEPAPNIFSFGDDDLYGQSGNDELVGDIGTWEMISNAGDNTQGFFGGPFMTTAAGADVFGVTFSMGSDLLDGGSGDDKIYGDVKNWTIDLEAGQGFNSGFQGLGSGSSLADVPGFFQPNVFVFGQDTLKGGTGHDEMAGEGDTLSIKLQGGTAVGEPGFGFVFADSVINFPLVFGDDSLDGGAGDDKMYGDWRAVNLQLTGGDYLTDFPVDGELAGIDATLNKLGFGADSLDGGYGADKLYGEGESLAIDLAGGNIAGPTGFGAFIDATATINQVVMGDDLLNGGANNDELYGDFKAIDINIVDGTGQVVNPPFGIFALSFASLGSDNPVSGSDGFVKFGDDVLDGGSGDDLLVGDAHAITYTHNGESFEQGVDVIWGNDLLIGGVGYDNIWGDVKNTSLVQGGADRFAFDLKTGYFGEDVLHDFRVANGDKLVFASDDGSINSLAQVDALLDEIVMVGADTKIKFLDGSVITLKDFTPNAAAPTSVADLFANPNDHIAYGVLGTDGDDVLNGLLTNITVFNGSKGNDTVTYAGAGAVTVDLSERGTYYSIENIIGSDDDDTFILGAPVDSIDGDAGNDTISFTNSGAAVTFDLANPTGISLTSIESIEGSAFDDFLTGDAANNTLSGGAGNDRLFSSLGDDVLDGGAGTQDFALYSNAAGSVNVDLAACKSNLVMSG